MRVISLSSYLSPSTLKVGSARTQLVSANKKIVFDAPSAIALSLHTGATIAYGEDAVRLAQIGSSDIRIVRLFSMGIPTDLELCTAYFHWMHQQIETSGLARFLPYPLVVATPVNLPPIYTSMVLRACRQAHFLPLSTLMAPIGDLRHALGRSDTQSPTLVVRLGASQTQLLLMTGGVSVFAGALPIGGDLLDQWCMLALFSRDRIRVPREQLVGVKEEYAKTRAAQTQFSIVVRGKHVETSAVRSQPVTGEMLHELYLRFFESCASQVQTAVAPYLPALSSNRHPAILLSGGLASLPEAGEVFSALFGVDVVTVSRPAYASALGVAATVNQKDGS